MIFLIPLFALVMNPLSLSTTFVSRFLRGLFLFGVVLGILSGCASPVVLMPAPAAFATDGRDPFARFGMEDETEMLIPYVTNRTPLIPGQHPIYTFFSK